MSSLPQALIRSLQNVKGFDERPFISTHLSGDTITSVRQNPAKIFNIQSSIFNVQLERIPWSSHGYYLPVRPSFTFDPLFHAGAYYVQEASSMFLEQVIRGTCDLSAPLRVLDLCAAPGGKSTLIQSLLSKESLLVSNEVIKARANILAGNITKWGAGNVIVTNNDPRDFQRLENYFDLVVVDAPCSGSGLFRKDPEAISEWSENNVELCSQRQQRILADVMPALKEGGILVYSTCSYSPEEDEEIGDWLCEEFSMSSLPIPLEENWGIVETVSAKYKSHGYRFYPDKLKGEGFFIAAFRKTGDGDCARTQRPKGKKELEMVTKKETDIIRPFLANADEFFYLRQNEQVIALPAGMEEDLELLQASLYIKKAGIKIGTIIRGELVPEHELAVSTFISEAVTRFEVDVPAALQYLRREEMKLDTEKRGWALLTVAQLPIGWVKLLGNRINNYYPAAWRILNRQ